MTNYVPQCVYLRGFVWLFYTVLFQMRFIRCDSGSVSDSFRFGDSCRISELCVQANQSFKTGKVVNEKLYSVFWTNISPDFLTAQNQLIRIISQWAIMLSSETIPSEFEELFNNWQFVPTFLKHYKKVVHATADELMICHYSI